MKHCPPTPDELRELRSRFGISQRKLAEIALVCTRVAQRWEAPTTGTQHVYPSASTWAVILHALGIKDIERHDSTKPTGATK